MKKTLLTILAIYTMAAVVACGNSKKNSGSSGDSDNLDCPDGSTFHLGYCIGEDGQVVGNGGVAFQSKMIGSTSYSYYNQNNLMNAGTLSITNRNTFNQLLKEGFGICDQGGYSAGTTSCSNFNNFVVSIQATDTDANSARVTLEAYPNYNMGGMNYWVSTPTWQQMGTCALTSFFFGGCYMIPTQYQNQYYHSNVLPLNMTLSVTNENKGFELRSYGATGTISQIKLLQLIVLKGSLESPSFDFYLGYNGKTGGVFAQGKMVRCATPSCGLLTPTPY